MTAATPHNDGAAALAAAMLKFRRARADILSADLFGEAAWDMLLELFVADAAGRRVTGRGVAERSDVPPSVMARWMLHLTRLGLIIGDGDGDLDDTLTLSGAGMAQMERVLARAQDLQVALE